MFVCLVFTVLTIVKTLLSAVRSAVYWPPPRCGQPFPLELAFISPQDFRCACEMSQSEDAQDPSAPSPGGTLPSLNIRAQAEDVREAVAQGGTGGESSQRSLKKQKSRIWEKVNEICAFISRAVVYFTGLLIIEGEDMRFDRTKPVEDFAAWQKDLDALTEKLSIEQDLIQKYDLDDLFDNLLKEEYEDLQKSGGAYDPAAAKVGVGKGSSTDLGDQAMRRKKDIVVQQIADLKQQFKDLWKNAKNRPQPLTTMMQEAIKAVQALDRMNNHEINEISVATYQVKLNNLRTKLSEYKAEETQNVVTVTSKELQDLESEKVKCVEAMDLSVSDPQCARCDHADLQSLDRQWQRLHEILLHRPTIKAEIDYLMQLLSSIQENSVWNNALEALHQACSCKKADERCAILKGLSNLHILSDDFCMGMALQIDETNSDKVLDAAFDELIQLRGRYLLGKYSDVLSGWEAGKVKDAVNTILSLCRAENLSMMTVLPILEDLRCRSGELHRHLNVLSTSADGELSFACPRLSGHDVAILFGFNKSTLPNRLLNRPIQEGGLTLRRGFLNSSRGYRKGFLASLAYLKDNGSRHPVFLDRSDKVDSLIERLDRQALENLGGTGEEVDDDGFCVALKEIYASVQFLVMPLVLFHQDFSHLSSMLRLSSTEESQKRINQLKERIKNDVESLSAFRAEMEDKSFERDVEGLRPTTNEEEEKIKCRISELERKIRSSERELERATQQADHRRAEICNQLSESMQRLLKEALSCFGKIVGRAALGERSMRQNWNDINRALSVCRNMIDAAQDTLRNKRDVTAIASAASKEWRESHKVFCKEQLALLVEDDPFRRALQMACEAVQIAHLKALQVLSATPQPAMDWTKLKHISKEAKVLSMQLRETCLDSHDDQDEIQKLAEALLSLERQCTDSDQQDQSHSLLSYIRNLILRSVHLCCSYAHTMQPLTWYRDVLCPTLEARSREVPLFMAQSMDEEHLKQATKDLSCQWKSCLFSITTSPSEQCIANPFQLLWIIDRFIIQQSSLHQTVSNAAHLFGQGVLDLCDELDKAAGLREQHFIVAAEGQPLWMVASRVSGICQRPLPSWTIQEIHEEFSLLFEALGQLSDTMMETRKHASPYLTDFLNKACDLWWYEATSSCMQRIQESISNSTVDSLAQRFSDRHFFLVDVDDLLVLDDFKDPSTLRKNLQDQGLDISAPQWPADKVEYLHVFASTLAQLHSEGRKKLLSNWRSYQTFETARKHIEEYDRFLKMHDEIMKTPPSKILVYEHEMSPSMKSAMTDACCVFQRLCDGIHKELANAAEQSMSRFEKVTQEADALMTESDSVKEWYHSHIDQFLDDRRQGRQEASIWWQTKMSDLWNRKENLCTGLSQATQELCHTYSLLWKDTKASFADHQPEWYLEEETGIPYYGERLQSILHGQQKLHEKSIIPDYVRMADYGLKWKTIRVDIEQLQMHRFWQSSGSKVEIKCEGGVGQGITIHHLDEIESVLPTSYGVLDEEAFKLVMLFEWENKQTSERRFRLRDLYSFNNFELRRGHRSKQKKYNLGFMAVKRNVCTVEKVPTSEGEDISPRKQLDQLHNLPPRLNKLLGVIAGMHRELEWLHAEETKTQEQEAQAAADLEASKNDYAHIKQSPHFRAFVKWNASIYEISNVLQCAANRLPNFSDSGEMSRSCSAELITAMDQALKTAQSPIFDERRLVLADPPSFNGDLSCTWTSRIQGAVRSEQKLIKKAVHTGTAGMHSMFIAWMQRLCQSGSSLSSAKDSDKLREACRDWTVSLQESSLSPQDQQSVILQTQRQCCSAMSLGSAREKWLSSCSKLEERREQLEHLVQQEAILLSGTSLRHASKLTVTQTDFGSYTLADAHSVIDFGTLLHVGDDQRSKLNAQLHSMEVMNRTDSTMLISVCPPDPSSHIFSVLSPSRVRLYGKSSHRFTFRISDQAFGRVCESWSIESDERGLEADFELRADVQRLAVLISSQEVDFGTLLTNSEERRRSVLVKNVTDLPLLIKSQIQCDETQSVVSISPPSFVLHPRKTESIEVVMKPAAHDETVNCQAVIGAAQNFKDLKVTAKIRQPKFELLNEKGGRIGTNFTLPTVKRGQTTSGNIRLRNNGDVPVSFLVTSDRPSPKVTPQSGVVSVGHESVLKLSVKSEADTRLFRHLVHISVKGSKAAAPLVISGQWIDPLPKFDKKVLEVEVPQEDLVKMVKGDGERSLVVTAQNVLSLKEDVPVTVYPPRSDYLTFDRTCYTVEKDRKSEVEMTWTVTQLSRKKHQITFLTDSGSECAFTVCLSWKNSSFNAWPLCWSPIACLAPGEEKTFDLKIPKEVSFAVKKEELECDSIKSLVLREKTNRSRNPNPRSWSLGSEEMPSCFVSDSERPHLQICLKTSETPGWIVEDICVESDQFVHLHQDLNRCTMVQHKLTLVAFVSENPNALDETMKSIGKSGKNRNRAFDAVFCLPDLDILRILTEEPTVQSFLMLMICEMGVFQSKWSLSEERATEMLDSTPEEAVELCVQHVMNTMGSASSGSSGHTESLREYFNQLKALFEERGHEAMTDIFIPAAAIPNKSKNVRLTAQALYMLLHASCSEEKRWRAAVGCMKQILDDTMAAALFDDTCQAIAESLSHRRRPFAENLTFLRNLMLSGDEDTSGCGLMDCIVRIVHQTEENHSLDHVLVNMLPADLQNREFILQALSSDGQNSIGLLMTLTNPNSRSAMTRLCSGEPAEIFIGFCQLMQQTEPAFRQDTLLSDVFAISEVDLLTARHAVSGADIWLKAKGIVGMFLQPHLRSMDYSLCSLLLHKSDGSRDYDVRKLVTEALQSMLHSFNFELGQSVTIIKNVALEISHDICPALHAGNEHIIDTALGRINDLPKRNSVKQQMLLWTNMNPADEHVDALVKPLVESIKVMKPKHSSSRSTCSNMDLDQLSHLLCQALHELDLPSMTPETSPLDLISRVIRFRAVLNDDHSASAQGVLSRLSSLAADFSKDNALSLCQAIAERLSSEPLAEALCVIIEAESSGQDLEHTALMAMLPEGCCQIFDDLVNPDSDEAFDVDADFMDNMEKLCNRSDLEMLPQLRQLIQAKNAVTSMDGEKLDSIEGLLDIKDLIEALDAYNCWKDKEKSRAALSVLFGLVAASCSADLTFEGICFTKMALLLSLTDFYSHGYWREYDWSSVKDDSDLKLVPAVIPEIAFSDEKSDEEEPTCDEVTEADNAAATANPENEIVAMESEDHWHWFLDEFKVPDEQIEAPDENDASALPDTSGQSSLGSFCYGGMADWMKCRELLRKTESAIAEVYSSIKHLTVHEETVQNVQLSGMDFPSIVKCFTTLKDTAGNWIEVFEESVRRCRRFKREYEKTAESRVVCTGISIVYLLRFCEEYLKCCSLFEMPGFLREIHNSMIQNLNAIPRNNLPREFRKMFDDVVKTTVVHSSTTEDFPMPSTKKHTTQPRKEDTPWHGSTSGEPSSGPYSAFEGVSVDPMAMNEAANAELIKKLKDAAGPGAPEATSGRTQRGILNQQITLPDDCGDTATWKANKETRDDESSSSTDEDDLMDCDDIDLSKLTAMDVPSSEHSRGFGDGRHKARDLAQEYEVFDAAPENKSMLTIQADLSRQVKMSRQQIAKQDLASIYKGTAIMNADVDKRELKDPVSVAPVRHDKWTYSLLVECKPFVRFLVEVMRQWEAHFEKFYSSTAERHVIEWCILVDNSGSMISKEIQMTEALVLVMETLKRLEQRFAVARFGNRKSQQMLKTMDEPFTQLIGQKILESFSFNEGTYPASAVRHVAEKVWPDRLSEDERLQCHRVMLLIMDGLTQERSARDYTSVCKDKDIDLVVLNLKDKAQNKIMSQIEGLWSEAASCYEVLDIESINLLPKLMAGLMNKYMENTLSKIEKNRKQLSSIKQTLLEATDLPDSHLHVDERIVLKNLEKQPFPPLPGSYPKESFFDCGFSSAGVPFETETAALTHVDVSLGGALSEDLYSEIQGLQTQTGKSDQLKATEDAWLNASERFSAEIDHMVEALDGFLPQNRFTRKRADIQGPSIHLPGFIKHIATKGNEKKIFANKKGGGRFEYSVAILLDISASMVQGRKRSCALQTVLMLISALKQMNIEDFSVILFGDGVYPIKLPDDAWEGPSIALLLSAVLQRNELSSMDADALLFAGKMLDQSCVRGPKKIFVVTDGYGSSGIRLAAVLKELDESGIDVTAMGIGPEEFFIKKCYPKWITAALPQLVPNALETLTDRIENAARMQRTHQKDTIDWLSVALVPEGAANTFEEVFVNRESVFPDLLELMQTEREARLTRGNRPSAVTVDICFALDCTGSMSFWLNAAKQQIKVRAQIDRWHRRYISDSFHRALLRWFPRRLRKSIQIWNWSFVSPWWPTETTEMLAACRSIRSLQNLHSFLVSSRR